MKNIKNFLKIGLFFSFLQTIVITLSVYFWDFFAGVGTEGFGLVGSTGGIGMFFIYMISYFSGLIVLLAIMKSENFGMGLFVWLPYAIVGLFVESYYEFFLNPVLVNFWAVLGWCIFGLLTGLSADISFKYLKEKTSLKECYIAGLTGMIISSVYFITTLFALCFFYIEEVRISMLNGPGSFLGVAYFTLPWMLINAFFGGYTAYSINKEFQKY